MTPDGPMQSRHRAGQQEAKRRGIHGGMLNLRRNGTIGEISKWIAYYEKQLTEGTFCKIRGAKILKKLQVMLEKKSGK